MCDVTASVYIQFCCPYLTTIINWWQTNPGGGASAPLAPLCSHPCMESLCLGHSVTILDTLPVLTFTPGSPESQQFRIIQSSISVGMQYLGRVGKEQERALLLVSIHYHICVETWRALTWGSRILQDKLAAISAKHVYDIGYKFSVSIDNFAK